MSTADSNSRASRPAMYPLSGIDRNPHRAATASASIPFSTLHVRTGIRIEIDFDLVQTDDYPRTGRHQRQHEVADTHHVVDRPIISGAIAGVYLSQRVWIGSFATEVHLAARLYPRRWWQEGPIVDLSMGSRASSRSNTSLIRLTSRCIQSNVSPLGRCFPPTLAVGLTTRRVRRSSIEGNR